ncbi:MAG: geranylgeranyl reductase family protein [Nitrospinota bacterium]
MNSGRRDVIVVGAGPAGSTAARRLALAGWDVLLLEKYGLDRRKACAGGISPRAVRALDFSIDAVVEHTVGAYTFSYCGRSLHRAAPMNLNIRMVRRSRFDRLLAQKAAEAGAEVRPRCPVEAVREEESGVAVLSRGRWHVGAALVGADGATGVVARSLGLARNVRLGAAVEGEVRVPPEQLREAKSSILFDMGTLPRGYRWIFPKGDHLNVGSCTTQQKVKGVKAACLALLEENPLLTGYSDLSMTGAPLPYLAAPCSFNTRRAAVCGDAAGLVDPLTGEGIQYAIETGNLAAARVDGFLRRGESLDRYTEQVLQTAFLELTIAEKFARLLLNHPHVSFKVGVRNRRVNALFADLVSGRTTYPEIYREIKHRFSWLFRAALLLQTARSCLSFQTARF